MKRLTLVLLFILAATGGNAQSRSRMLREVSGKWEITNDRKVVFSKIYEFPGKSQQELFQAVEAYYQYHFVENPITAMNREQGRIDAHAIFPPVSVQSRDASVVYDMVVQFKEGRVRMNVLLQSYDVTQYPENDPKWTSTLRTRTYSSNPLNTYPIDPDASDQPFSLTVFYRTCNNAEYEMNRLRDFIIDGIPASEDAFGLEEDW